MKKTRQDDLLIDGRKILQHEKGYHFTSDAVRLANFVDYKPTQRIIELGSGSGIIGILLALFGAHSIQMVEIQKDLAATCLKSIKMNNLNSKIKVLNAPLQNCHKKLGTYDIVVCNPPFEKADPRFKQNEETIAKFEFKVTFKEIAQEAAQLLTTGGKFFFVFPSTRLFEAGNTLDEFGFKIKKCNIFYPRGEIANTVYVLAVKGAREGAIIGRI